MPESKGIVSKMLGFLFVVAMIFWVADNPHDAAQFFDNAIRLFQRLIVGIMQALDDIGKSN